MEFYLIRHGVAEEPVEGQNDIERALTEKGIEKVKAVAELAKEILPKPKVILTSEAIRAYDTAFIFKKTWRIGRMDSYAKLNPGASIFDYVFILGAYITADFVKSDRKIAIITHQPDLSNFVFALLDRKIQFDFNKNEIAYDIFGKYKPPAVLNLKKSSILVMDWDGEVATIKFYATPSFLKTIVKVRKKSK